LNDNLPKFCRYVTIHNDITAGVHKTAEAVFIQVPRRQHQFDSTGKWQNTLAVHCNGTKSDDRYKTRYSVPWPSSCTNEGQDTSRLAVTVS